MKLNINRRIFRYFSNLSLGAGLVLGVYALSDIYLSGRTLPTGTCPVSGSRPLLYAAIALCCVSFVFSFFEPKNKEQKIDD